MSPACGRQCPLLAAFTLVLALLVVSSNLLVLPAQAPATDTLRAEYQRLDGWYNNLANSDWGAPNQRLRRRVAPAYADGVYQMVDEPAKPSARRLSQRLMRGEDGLASGRNLTTMFAFFGQLISSEILMASESGCPIEMHRVKIDTCDPMYDVDCRGGRTMPFYRAAYDSATGQSPNLPREQINRVTSWIDGSFIYSTSETWLNAMRSFDGRGTLKTRQIAELRALEASISGSGAASDADSSSKSASSVSPQIGYPPRNDKRAPLINSMPAHALKMKAAERMFLLGDARTNQNPLLLTFAILFHRWHNVLAERLHAQHPNWSDEEKFQRARRLVIASLQNIILYEYLPTLLGSQETNNSNSTTPVTIANDDDSHITPYTGYKPDLHPGVSHVFQSAAFRFGHTLIPPGLYVRDDKCRFARSPQGFAGVRLCSTWWNAEELVTRVGVEQLLMGAASQVAEREDSVLCNDVRDKLFGPMDFSRRDLAALNIMRGRDNGLPDYNSVRAAFKLRRARTWSDINPPLFVREPHVFAELAALYDSQLDKLDLYVGGMLESDLKRGRPGPLFRRIIREQFERLRDADRFWFENVDSGLFSAAEIAEIRRIKLYDVIVNSTLIPETAIQRNVFQFQYPQDPCPQPAQLSSDKLQPCYSLKGQSYFKGNELTYALVILTLVLVPAVCMLIANLVLTHQDTKRRRFKSNQQYERNARRSRVSSSSSTNEGRDENQHQQPNSDQRKTEKFAAKEWLHANLRRRVKVRLGAPPDATIYVLDRSGAVLRELSLASASSCVLEYSGSGATATTTSPIISATKGSRTASTASLVSSSSSSSSRVASAAVVGKSPDLVTPGALLDDADETANNQRGQKPLVLVRVEREYDLVLQLDDLHARRKFVARFSNQLRACNKSMQIVRVSRDEMLANAETKERRQQRLEHFFREAYALTFGLSAGASSNHGSNSSTGNNRSPTVNSSTTTSSDKKVSADVALVMRTSLSRLEFAEALGMRADSVFVSQMFNCIDKDRNGRISFQEFLDTVVAFSRGKPDDKLRIVFDMCDYEGSGMIEKCELVRMLRSLVDLAKTRALTESDELHLIDNMFKAVGLDKKPLLTYDDFKLVVGNFDGADGNGSELQHQDSPMATTATTVGLDMKGVKKNFFVDTSNSANSLFAPSSLATKQLAAATTGHHHQSERKMTLVDTQTVALSRELARQRPTNAAKTNARFKRLAAAATDKWREIITELEEHRQDIVYLLVFFVTIAVLFLERFINYSFLSEHMDLRHVMGVGIAITRGSAAALSFCYAMLLLSMCRNIMTKIRVTPLREYIPLDSHVKFHKIVAITALIMTILHTGGHCINFFHVTQQPVEHLRCLTKEMQFNGEARPTFFYWIFQTVTGTTGLLLWVLCSILYVFAQAKVRARAYAIFWSTHKLYYLIYALSLMHGSSKLTGSPRFWLFFIGPAIVFTIDKIISLQTKLLQLEIIKTECLPSDVTFIKFARPPSFKFLSGQWIRVACTAFRQHEFHAFTLTSAPQDDFLSIHVRAQGPWTWKLRSLFDPANVVFRQHQKKLVAAANADLLPPRIRIEGPFGGGNQDWYKYEVAVMIGGGIGVTPYASILNDLVFGTSTSRYSGSAHKKVYFIWICPSHRNFEWFIDVLRDVENKDVTNVLEMHIFITQFFHKFDLRTTMLYICENHFQRISNRSLFTGLKAINHFGRPDVAALLQYVQKKHSCVSKVGVFSCGPKAMTKSVTQACEKVNQRRKLPFFLHQYENFS